MDKDLNELESFTVEEFQEDLMPFWIELKGENPLLLKARTVIAL
jgi:hypothetical protein